MKGQLPVSLNKRCGYCQPFAFVSSVHYFLIADRSGGILALTYGSLQYVLLLVHVVGNLWESH